MFTDFVVNGQPVGEFASHLSGMHYDPGLMRPFLDSKQRPSVMVNTGILEPRKLGDGSYVVNAAGEPELFPKYEKQLITHRMLRGMPCPVINTQLLPKDAWIRLDNIIQTAARLRLRAYADLRATNTFGGFDGMANPILEWERVTDNGEAVTDMDGMTEARNFAPKYELQGMPLPITHADFWLSSRFLAVSRNRGTPADTIRAEMAARRVAELIEQTTIGTQEGDQYGDSTGYAHTSKVYGYLTHPDRILKANMPVPTGSNGAAIRDAFIACRELLYNNKFFGPFMVYASRDYDAYLDGLFSTTEVSAGTLRGNLVGGEKGIQGIRDIRTLDYLDVADHPFTLIWVDMNRENVEAVNGMEITTIQWESMGGMRLNFKVMAIQVPRIRSRFTGGVGSTTAKAGVLVATTS